MLAITSANEIDNGLYKLSLVNFHASIMANTGHWASQLTAIQNITNSTEYTIMYHKVSYHDGFPFEDGKSCGASCYSKHEQREYPAVMLRYDRVVPGEPRQTGEVWSKV